MTGAELIATERHRQIFEEQWSTYDDDQYTEEELIDAAHCYINARRYREVFLQEDAVPLRWPWNEVGWKPTPEDRMRELVKAGALIAAEIDRLQRIKAKANTDLKIT
jgi:hypothetical protein